MMCRDCNNIYNDNFKYCPYCGSRTPLPKYCIRCREVIEERDFKYCPKCGTRLVDATQKNMNDDLLYFDL